MLLNKKQRRSLPARTRLICLLLGTSMPPPLGAVRIGINAYSDTATIAYGDRVTAIDGGIIRGDDGYSSINGFRLDDVGDTAGRHYRDNSLFTVTLTGYQHGHTIQLPVKLGRTTFNTRSVSSNTFNDNHVVNNGCVRVEPSSSDGPARVQTVDIDPGNNIRQNCTGSTVEFRYRDIQPVQGIRREVLFDLPAMMRSEAYQRLPPDLYFVQTHIANLEHWQARVGGSRDFPLPLDINIRKQAYFSGLSLPSTSMPLKVTYVGQRVRGSASMPITLRGAFDPQFGKVRLSAQSSGGFSLRSGSGAIPYQAEAVVNQQRYALNERSSASAPIILRNLNDVRQIPLRLEVTFDQPRSQISVSGSYRDNLTLIAEVPLI
ncbi:fimbrial protein [Edwardsiella tarda]|uniref:fimbrial protein n=1 Tax=Edwardsiella tarda TaxID=636 RepID=UPI003F65EFBB